ncbi:CynX/NimT family MFS transporter [Litorivicinus lipolyticus]|uniref:MFS transporter n=1 Tax=Litorivicinus lipolyticus TaxID=418701 RepID=UPI003B5A2652
MFVFVLLWVVGYCLRLTILAMPPVAAQLTAAFDLSASLTGALTTLPMLTIAIGAWLTHRLVQRFGLAGTVVVGLGLTALLSTARVATPDVALLMAATAGMGAAIGVFQTALPALVTQWTPTRIAFGCAVYLNGMMMGEWSAAGLTLPLVAPVIGADWRAILLFWSSLVAVAAVGVTLRTWLAPSAVAPTELAVDTRTYWGRQAFSMGIPLGASIAAFYAVNAYAAELAIARGELDALPRFLFLFNLTPMLASFVVLRVSHWIGQPRPIWIATLVTALALSVFVVTDGVVGLLAACVAGFFATLMMILLMALPSILWTGSAASQATASMSVIGYVLGFTLPLAGGMLVDGFGWAPLALIPIALLLMGCLVCRPVAVR